MRQSGTQAQQRSHRFSTNSLTLGSECRSWAATPKKSHRYPKNSGWVRQKSGALTELVSRIAKISVPINIKFDLWPLKSTRPFPIQDRPSQDNFYALLRPPSKTFYLIAYVTCRPLKWQILVGLCIWGIEKEKRGFKVENRQKLQNTKYKVSKILKRSKYWTVWSIMQY